METAKEYYDFCEGLLIEELIKDFNFNCELVYIGKKRYGGSKITTYYFKDNFKGIVWEKDVSDGMWWEIVSRSPKMRARRV